MKNINDLRCRKMVFPYHFILEERLWFLHHAKIVSGKIYQKKTVWKAVNYCEKYSIFQYHLKEAVFQAEQIVQKKTDTIHIFNISKIDDRQDIVLWK